jgi:hypothetical protein
MPIESIGLDSDVIGSDEGMYVDDKVNSTVGEVSPYILRLSDLK